MTREKVNMLAQKFDKEIPSVCSFRFRNKLSKASDEKYEDVLNTPLKKKGPAISLSVFLGWFGAHRFYLGDKKQGWITVIMFAIIAALLSVTIALSATFYSNLKSDLSSQLGDKVIVSVVITEKNGTKEASLDRKIGTMDDLSFSTLFSQVMNTKTKYQVVEASSIIDKNGLLSIAPTTNVEEITIENPAAIFFDIYGLFTILLFAGFFAWYIVDIIRTVEDVPFVNYERLMMVATGTDKNLYKAGSLEESEEVEEATEEVDEAETLEQSEMTEEATEEVEEFETLEQSTEEVEEATEEVAEETQEEPTEEIQEESSEEAPVEE